MSETTGSDPTPPQSGPPPSPETTPVPAPLSAPPAPAPAPSAANARTFMMLCHLSAFAGFFIPFFGNVLGPLVVWLMKKDELPGVDAHGKASLNFQISMSIYMVVAGILILLLIGIPLTIGLAVLWLVAVIMASVKANEGVLFKYPLSIPFLQ